MSVAQAEQFEENEQYEEAYSEYLQAYETNPKDLNVLERLGHNALLLDKKSDAERYYNEILQLDATNTMAYEMLMDIYISTDKYKYYVSRGNLHYVEHQLEHAISDFKKALQNTQEEEDMVKVHFVLANLYEQTDNSMKAIDEYLKIVNFEKTNEVVYLKLANLYIKENAQPSAVGILERALEHGYDSDLVKENLAQLYLKEGDNEKALEISPAEFTKIKALLGLERCDEAKEKLDKLSSENSTQPVYLSLMAEYYFTKGLYNEALEYVNKYDEVQKNSPLTYQMKALIYENKDDEFNAHLNWGKYNIVRGNRDVAINEYLTAYQINSEDKALVSSLASLLEENGDKTHAMEFYEKLSKLDETDKTALKKLAEFRESIGDYRMQAEYLEQLLQISSRDFMLTLKIAKLYEKLKNKPAAIEYYKKYLSIAPVSDEYTKVEEMLANLEHTPMDSDEGLVGFIMKIFNKK